MIVSAAEEKDSATGAMWGVKSPCVQLQVGVQTLFFMAVGWCAYRPGSKAQQKFSPRCLWGCVSLRYSAGCASWHNQQAGHQACNFSLAVIARVHPAWGGDILIDALLILGRPGLETFRRVLAVRDAVVVHLAVASW